MSKSILLGATVLILFIGILFVLFRNPMFQMLLHIKKSSFSLSEQETGEVHRDIVFKQVEDIALKLEIYRPLQNVYEKAPVVVFVHGGGWLIGGLSELFVGEDNHQILTGLRNKGYAVANFEYRLLSESVAMAQIISDTKDVVRWLRLNSEQYALDPENIGIWGQSAGAQLALMAAYTTDSDFVGDAGLSPFSAEVNYVVNNYGLTHLPIQFKAVIEDPTGRTMEHKQARYLFENPASEDRTLFETQLPDISPVHQLKRYAKPTLTIHGDEDQGVSVEQAYLLEAKLKENAVPNELMVVPGAGHIFMNATDAQIDQITEKTIHFIESQLQQPAL